MSQEGGSERRSERREPWREACKEEKPRRSICEPGAQAARRKQRQTSPRRWAGATGAAPGALGRALDPHSEAWDPGTVTRCLHGVQRMGHKGERGWESLTLASPSPRTRCPSDPFCMSPVSPAVCVGNLENLRRLHHCGPDSCSWVSISGHIIPNAGRYPGVQELVALPGHGHLGGQKPRGIHFPGSPGLTQAPGQQASLRGPRTDVGP